MGNSKPIKPYNLTRIARVTGESLPGETLPNPNQTHIKYNVNATDLGIMWDKGDGEIFIALGDTYGKCWGGSGAGPETAEWRSNVLAVSNNRNPEEGLIFSKMITDGLGSAKELICAERVYGREWTIIPTAGVTVGNKHYLHFMSIHRWGTDGNGRWKTNYSGVAISEDNGHTWVKSEQLKWENNKEYDNRFQQAAFVKEDGYVYMFTTENGRHGDIYLGRVIEEKIEFKDEYRYWDGSNWVEDERAAMPITNGPAGELSVAYNSYYKKWIMIYLSPKHDGLVLLSSQSLTGPWSEEELLVSRNDYPRVYGGFIHPSFNDGKQLYFNMTQWDPYNVFWMKVDLVEEEKI